MNEQVNYAKIQRIQDNLEALTIGTFGTGFVTDAMLYESGIKATVAQHTSDLAEIIQQKYVVNALRPPTGLDALVGDGITDNSSKLNALINYCSTNKHMLYVPAGIYKITSKITLGVFTYIFGLDKENTVFLIDDDYVIENNTTVFACSSAVSNYDIRMENITLKISTTTKVVFDSTHEGTLLWLCNVKRARLYNVDLLNNLNSTYSNRCTCLWIREDSQNITLEKCNIINASGNTVGGSAWIWAYAANSVISNIYFINCNISHNSADECIGIWGAGTIDNVKFVDNNIIINNTVSSTMAFSILNGTIGVTQAIFKNIKYINNKITINGLVQNIFYYNFDIANANGIEINGNEITFANVSGSTVSNVFLNMLAIIGGETEIDMHNRVKPVDISNNTITNTYVTTTNIINNKDCVIKFKDNYILSSYATTNLCFYDYISTKSKTFISRNIITILGRIFYSSTLEGWARIFKNEVTMIDNASYVSILRLLKHSSYGGVGTGVVVVFDCNSINGVKAYIMESQIKADVIVSNNIFDFTNIQVYYNASLGTTFKKLLIYNNEFGVSSGSLDDISTTITNTIRKFERNTINGSSMDVRSSSPTDNVSKYLYANGQIITNVTDDTSVGWKKISDVKWNAI